MLVFLCHICTYVPPLTCTCWRATCHQHLQHKVILMQQMAKRPPCLSHLPTKAHQLYLRRHEAWGDRVRSWAHRLTPSNISQDRLPLHFHPTTHKHISINIALVRHATIAAITINNCQPQWRWVRAIVQFLVVVALAASDSSNEGFKTWAVFVNNFLFKYFINEQRSWKQSLDNANVNCQWQQRWKIYFLFRCNNCKSNLKQQSFVFSLFKYFYE